jgi:multicomponent Na+:H+ antiporter subunit E
MAFTAAFQALYRPRDVYTGANLSYPRPNPSVSRAGPGRRDAEQGRVGSHGVRNLFTAVLLFALWLLMSGIYKPLIVGFGAASVVLVLYIVRRMDAVDGDRAELRLKPVAFLGYLIWLLWEIAKANWAVTKIVLSPHMPIRQHLFHVRHTQKSDLGQVIFANSITLTPGTITVETEPGHFLVHALAYSADDNLALADMDRRVTRIEAGPAA